MTDFKIITSADNPQFKTLKKLATSARERRKTGKTLLDGIHLLNALADINGNPELLIVREGNETDPEIQHCLNCFINHPTLLLSKKLFDAVSPVEQPTGILGLWPIPQPETKPYQSAVLLENIQDPGNLGSILRTSAAAGIDAIFLSKGCAEAWSPKALRTGMGAHFVTAIHEHNDLITTSCQFDTVAATCLDGKQSLYEVNFNGTVAFIFGNEGAGLSPELAACANANIRIPMPGNIESLNVAAAAAVCLFERVRQAL